MKRNWSDVDDALIELLIRIVHRIGVRAQKKIVKELLSNFQRLQGKTTLLFKIAEVALDNPEGTIKDVLSYRQRKAPGSAG